MKKFIYFRITKKANKLYRQNKPLAQTKSINQQQTKLY